MSGLFTCIAIFLVRAAMVGSIVIFLWVIVAQATSATLLGVVFFSLVFGMVSRRVKLDKARLGESMLVGCV